MNLPPGGTPSDEVAEILATGRSGASVMFVSMSSRHPDGADANYLEWHTLDHRPEQHRLAQLRCAMRLVSTPECRIVRAASEGPLDRVDHVMTYFFTDRSGLAGFTHLSTALRGAGRTPYVLPPVERGAYDVRERVADPDVSIGADVLPWWPATGVYLLVEPTALNPEALVRVAGVAGAWSAVATDVSEHSTAPVGQQITYCFLDDDPVVVAERLRPILASRWHDAAMTPLLAAPFHFVTGRDWARHLP